MRFLSSFFLLLLSFSALDQADAGEKQVVFIQGMTCANCSSKIRQSFEATGKVEKVVVNFRTGRTEIEWKDGAMSDQELGQFLASIEGSNFKLKKSDG